MTKPLTLDDVRAANDQYLVDLQAWADALEAQANKAAAAIKAAQAARNDELTATIQASNNQRRLDRYLAHLDSLPDRIANGDTVKPHSGLNLLTAEDRAKLPPLPAEDDPAALVRWAKQAARTLR